MMVARYRKWLVGVALALGLVVLAVQVAMVAPTALAVWHPWDYSNYVEMGRSILRGENPYGHHKFYPLPTMLWIFVPLALAPDWFRLVWILLPFVFILRLLGTRGIWFFIFPPLWFVLSDAMFDAWLLIPLAWLFANRRTWAGVGAAILLFKPHVTGFAVGYMVLCWLFEREWRTLSVFGLTMAIFWLPSFIVRPTWVWEMLNMLQTRAEYVGELPLLTTSLWSWWALDGVGRVVSVGLGLVTMVLFVRALRQPERRAAAIHLGALIFNPIMLASNLISVVPTVHTRRNVILVVLASCIALGLDRGLNGFGGGYALIPLVALYAQGHDGNA